MTMVPFDMNPATKPVPNPTATVNIVTDSKMPSGESVMGIVFQSATGLPLQM